MAEKKDVAKPKDLYEELDEALEKDKEEAGKKGPGASPEKPQEKKPAPKEKEAKPDEKPEKKEGEDKEGEDADQDGSEELSEEEISKLSPRAQKRIRELADQVKELAKKPPEKPADAEDGDQDQQFNNVQEFLAAVEDEPSRKLLETFYKVITKDTKSILEPWEKKNREAKFDEEFAEFAEIEGIGAYKEDLKKTYMRDPGKSVKALVGETLVDIQGSKIKPQEKGPSAPNREGDVDLDTLDKEQLYEKLDQMKDK